MPTHVPRSSAAGRSQGALAASTRFSSTWARASAPCPMLPLASDVTPPAQVAVQLPMFNERAVCQAIIDCCAELDWPAQRLKIQVGAAHEATSAGSCPLPSPAHAAARRPPSTHLGCFGQPVPWWCGLLVLDDSTDAVTRELVDEKVGGRAGHSPALKSRAGGLGSVLRLARPGSLC